MSKNGQDKISNFQNKSMQFPIPFVLIISKESSQVDLLEDGRMYQDMCTRRR